MVYYKKSEYTLRGYEKAKGAKTKYQAILERKSDKTISKVQFGAVGYQNYSDKTGLGLYKGTTTKQQRDAYRARHEKGLKDGYWSPGWFS